MRRVAYLEQAGFVRKENDYWVLGDAGREYVQQYDMGALLRIMCDRNIGLRSLMYALAAGPMTIGEISDQQLDTHPELGWSRGETDMAKQRANWLRSMGFVEKRDDEYALTDDGLQFVESAVEEWADSDWTPSASDAEMNVGTRTTRLFTLAQWIRSSVRLCCPVMTVPARFPGWIILVCWTWRMSCRGATIRDTERISRMCWLSVRRITRRLIGSYSLSTGTTGCA